MMHGSRCITAPSVMSRIPQYVKHPDKHGIYYNTVVTRDVK